MNRKTDNMYVNLIFAHFKEEFPLNQLHWIGAIGDLNFLIQFVTTESFPDWALFVNFFLESVCCFVGLGNMLAPSLVFSPKL